MVHLCSLWITENIQWRDANWNWDECQLIKELCDRWSTTADLWKNSDWQWSKCHCSLKWIKTDVKWKDANWLWSVCLPIEVIPPIPPIPPTPTILEMRLGVDATTLIQPWLEEPWDPYKSTKEEREKKRKRLIKLICKVKGKTYEEEKLHGDFDISVDDIKLMVKKIGNIELKIG